MDQSTGFVFSYLWLKYHRDIWTVTQTLHGDYRKRLLQKTQLIIDLRMQPTNNTTHDRFSRWFLDSKISQGLRGSALYLNRFFLIQTWRVDFVQHIACNGFYHSFLFFSFGSLAELPPFIKISWPFWILSDWSSRKTSLH